tara:strand:- start:27 stop:320 length:294 start_codon:yes stop_codon:yes gene_type:complete
MKRGIDMKCPKCRPSNGLNCYCSDNPDYWNKEAGRFVPKDINDFDNIFNYIEWICETQIYYEMQVWRMEELEAYIEGILLENHKLNQLLAIAANSLN